MAKEITRVAKLQFNAGQAKPGPELAGLGIVMPEFTKQFNADTSSRGSEPVPVTITIFNDKSFTFKTHTAPASYKLLQAAGLKKGSDNAKTTKIATIKKSQVQEIAEYKMEDLNTNDVEAAVRIIAGTAKNMGILIEGIDNVEAEKAAAAQASKDANAAEVAEAALDAAATSATENKEFTEAESDNGSADVAEEGTK